MAADERPVRNIRTTLPSPGTALALPEDLAPEPAAGGAALIGYARVSTRG
jgi:hypothetical protein